MASVNNKKVNVERREYQRTKTECPVNFFTPADGKWADAILADYSPKGMSFYCDGEQLIGEIITIQITRDAHPTVPPMAASAKVVRCEEGEGCQFKIACKLTRILDKDSIEKHYLRR